MDPTSANENLHSPWMSEKAKSTSRGVDDNMRLSQAQGERTRLDRGEDNA